MATRKSTVVPFQLSADSAVEELKRQLDQAYALAHGARQILGKLSEKERAAIEPADCLLDMAEDILADREYIARLESVHCGEQAGAA